MTKALKILVFCLYACALKAQDIPSVQPFGKIDISDLQMKECEFEKDANAEILIHKANAYYSGPGNGLTIDFHKRIKIFNENGKRYANMRVEFLPVSLTGLQAQTINLEDSVPVITKVDKSQIFIEKTDSYQNATIIAFPNVKPGSIIEIKYTINTNIGNYPNWYFQNSIPTRYSEIRTLIPDLVDYKTLEAISQPYAVNTTDKNGASVKALTNVPSIPDEPYMTTVKDNCQRILFKLLSINFQGQSKIKISQTWSKVGEDFAEHAYLAKQIDRKLNNEDAILTKAKTLATDNQKIEYIFNEVKNTVAWNKWYSRLTTTDGIQKAWDIKTGNSAEINLILCRLLKKAKILSYPMVASTRNNERINPTYPTPYQFNTTVAYIPVNNTTFYVLDATNKYNVYNQIPVNLLNSFGLFIDKDKQTHSLVFLDQPSPAKRIAFITANISPEGIINGTAEIDNYTYNRLKDIETYKKDGEEKFINYLHEGDNSLLLSGLKFENMDVDSLPLKESMNFSLALTGADNNYIYFNPNILTSIKNNPFLSKKRLTDIDFGYPNSYITIGSYTIPKNYQTEALPKNISLVMPDKSITFKRIIVEQNNTIIIRYTIEHKKSIYFKQEYPELHEFYRQMYQMLNEQIVLKRKSS